MGEQINKLKPDTTYFLKNFMTREFSNQKYLSMLLQCLDFCQNQIMAKMIFMSSGSHQTTLFAFGSILRTVIDKEEESITAETLLKLPKLKTIQYNDQFVIVKVCKN